MLISVLAVPCALASGERPEIVYSHGFSYVVPMKYPPDFTHFEYVNPNAPKVGMLKASNRGVWDSFNGIHCGRCDLHVPHHERSGWGGGS